jgi:hypothetical protein
LGEGALPTGFNQNASSLTARKSAQKHRVRVATELEWSVIRAPDVVRHTILQAVTRYR